MVPEYSNSHKDLEKLSNKGSRHIDLSKFDVRENLLGDIHNKDVSYYREMMTHFLSSEEFNSLHKKTKNQLKSMFFEDINIKKSFDSLDSTNTFEVHQDLIPIFFKAYDMYRKIRNMMPSSRSKNKLGKEYSTYIPRKSLYGMKYFEAPLALMRHIALAEINLGNTSGVANDAIYNILYIKSYLGEEKFYDFNTNRYDKETEEELKLLRLSDREYERARASAITVYFTNFEEHQNNSGTGYAWDASIIEFNDGKKE